MTELHSIDRFVDSLDANHASRRGQQGDALRWSDLDRQLRKALSRVLGGGSLRAIAPEIVRDLRQLGLIEVERQSARLTPAGWELLRSSREWLRAAPEPLPR
jgi:RNase P/RNase MRP subunit POP5